MTMTTRIATLTGGLVAEETTDDFLSPLMTGATALHENMLSFVAAGFTREESMRITLTILVEMIRKQNGNGSGLCRLRALSAYRG